MSLNQHSPLQIENWGFKMRRVLLKEPELFTSVVKIAKKVKAPPQVVSWIARKCPTTFQLDKQPVKRGSLRLVIGLRPGAKERMDEDPLYRK